MTRMEMSVLHRCCFALLLQNPHTWVVVEVFWGGHHIGAIFARHS